MYIVWFWSFSVSPASELGINCHPHFQVGTLENKEKPIHQMLYKANISEQGQSLS